MRILPILFVCLAAWPSTATGQSGHALQFDRADEDRVYVTMDAPTASFTLAACVFWPGDCRTEPGCTWDVIISFDRNPWFGLNFDGNLQLLDTIVGGQIEAQTWTHVAYTWDGSTSRLFVNAVEVAQNDVAPPVTGTFMWIGQNHGATWGGMLDDVVLWNDARTASQLSREMNGLTGDHITDPLLIGYFNFDEGSGQLVANQKFSGPHGMLGSSLSQEQTDPVWVNLNQSLPIELATLDAVVAQSDVTLTWSTTSEVDNAGFEIEHRRGSGEFVARGFVDGRGNTVTEQSYSFVVSGLGPGRHSFRLKNVDFNGDFHHSPAVEVFVDAIDDFTLSSAYPNPFNPQTNVMLGVRHTQSVQVDVLDITGRHVATLFSGTIAAGSARELTFVASNVGSGFYLIRAAGERFSETRRVLLLK